MESKRNLPPKFESIIEAIVNDNITINDSDLSEFIYGNDNWVEILKDYLLEFHPESMPEGDYDIHCSLDFFDIIIQIYNRFEGTNIENLVRSRLIYIGYNLTDFPKMLKKYIDFDGMWNEHFSKEYVISENGFIFQC